MTFCWNFMDANTFYWVFSTLAQVFGALLALLGVFMIFKLDRYKVLLESVDKGTSESYIPNRGTKDIQTDVLKSRQDFIERSKLTLSLTAFVVIYSIIILPLSGYLISKKLIAILLMMIFGITVPIIVLIVIVSFIMMSFPYLKKKLDVKSILHCWKFWKW